MNGDGKFPTGQPPPQGPVSVPYASPGAHVKSQWVTDDGPGGRWLVGCLIVVSVVGALVAAVAGAAAFFFTGF